VTPRPFPILVLAALACCAAGAAFADTINPGNDFFETLPGTSWDFSSQPIPADFFGPGSLPFDGVVRLVGDKHVYGECTADPPADFVLLRPSASNPPDQIPVFVAQLSLASAEPLVIHFAGGAVQAWNAHLELAPVPVPFGTMTIRHEVADGGTFDLSIPVFPQFVFTNVAGGQVLRYHSTWPTPFGATNVPWHFDVVPPGSCRSNFCVNPNAATSIATPYGHQVVADICPSTITAVEGGETPSTWGRVKGSYR
jgi:hypothetical protein